MDYAEATKILVPIAVCAGMYLKIQQAVRTMAGKGEPREISNDPLKVQEQDCPATIGDVKQVEKRVVRLEAEFKDHKTHSDEFRERMHGDFIDLKDRMSDQMLEQSSFLRAIERSIGRLEGN